MSIPISKRSFGQWEGTVHAVCCDPKPEPTVEEVEALIERGKQLKSEGKVPNYDKWAHSMWMLKKKLREVKNEHESNQIKLKR